jgi:DNA repair exonuclease SbcCD ATPase subunit
MATHAKLTSVDALDAFRSSLIVFLNKAHSALDQSSDEIRRVRSWIQHDQRTLWESEVRRRARNLAQAEQELLSARMTKALDNLSAQQQAVNKARHAFEEASEKLRKVKLWMRDFDGTVEPMAKALNSLRGYLDHDMPRAIGYLTEVQKIMDSYMEAPRQPASAPADALPVGQTPVQPL